MLSIRTVSVKKFSHFRGPGPVEKPLNKPQEILVCCYAAINLHGFNRLNVKNATFQQKQPWNAQQGLVLVPECA